MKFFYLKRKDGAIVCATYDSNDEGTWTELFYGGSYNTDQPYFSTRDTLVQIASGKFNNDWAFDIPKKMQKDFSTGLVEIIEVEL